MNKTNSLGKKQAEITGKYLREHFGTFDAFYTSEYVRAMETAALLNLPHAKWVTDFYLRERDWGQLVSVCFYVCLSISGSIVSCRKKKTTQIRFRKERT